MSDSESLFDRPLSEWTHAELDAAITEAAERRAFLEELIHALGVERAERTALARSVNEAMTTATAEIVGED